MGVEFKRKEYTESLHRWLLVDECAGGMDNDKTRKKHIIYSGSAEKTKEELARYEIYVQRAIFYNYILRTIGGLSGMATSDDLVFEAGPRLEYAKDNIDGKGTTLEQAFKRTMSRVIAHGRYGVLVDFPSVDGAVTQANMSRYTAKAVGYDAEQIINWGYEERDGLIKLSLVVLVESVEERADNGFDIESVVQYRVLSLADGVYTVTLYDDGGEIKIDPVTPRKADGSLFDYIPFQFFGAADNDGNVDDSLMYDMAVLNVGHFQNSADYENSLWLCGQPQPWFTGMTQAWMDQNYPKGVFLGSGALLTGPEGAQFGIEQTQPNTQAFEAMNHKQDQMVAMGAKMVTADGGFNTATEASMNNKGETSFLQSVMSNVNGGWQQVIEWMAVFTGETEYGFDNPTDLGVFIASPQLLQQMRESWFAGIIADVDLRGWMRKHGLIERGDEEIKDDIETSPPAGTPTIPSQVNDGDE